MILRRAVLLLVITSLLATLFFTTNPNQLPAAVFVVTFILLYGGCYLLLSIAGLLGKRANMLGWSDARVNRTSWLLAIFPVFLLVLQSIGQLTVRDVLLASGLFVLLYMYFTRLTAQNSQK